MRVTDTPEGIEGHRGTEDGFLKQGEEVTPFAEICREAGISQATYSNLKKRQGGRRPDEMRCLKSLEDQSTKLKR